MCSKRCYRSTRDAKRHTMKVGNGFRVYWCSRCGAYHVTNREGAGQHYAGRLAFEPRKRPRRRDWRELAE